MDINGLANNARSSISNYCINECNAFCCRKGFLDISIKEADLITNNKINQFEKSKNIIKKEDTFALDLNKTCPSLINSKCTIHTNPRRPKMCQEFPIFVKEKEITFSQGCPAVRNKMFYPFETQFLELGYKLTFCK